jgi:hypothetical protein
VRRGAHFRKLMNHRFSKSDMLTRVHLVIACIFAVVAVLLALATLQSGHGLGKQVGGPGELQALTLQVEHHMRLVHSELQAMFDHVCVPEPPVPLPAPSEQEVGNVNLPFCSELEDAGLQPYYGNLYMLLVEAWRAKITPALHAIAAEPAPRPHAELVTVHADGLLAGAIYVQQLRTRGQLSSSAVMIGIHRMPRHKMLKLRRIRSSVVVTDAVIGRVKQWCSQHGIARLLVCPYQELMQRLRRLGFRPIDPDDLAAVDPLLFGDVELVGQICEDSTLHGLAIRAA